MYFYNFITMLFHYRRILFTTEQDLKEFCMRSVSDTVTFHSRAMSTEQPSVDEEWPPQHAVIDKWFEEQSPDIILQVEGFRLPCHKEVLMNQSEYFKVSRRSHYHILTVLYNNMMHSLWAGKNFCVI